MHTLACNNFGINHARKKFCSSVPCCSVPIFHAIKSYPYNLPNFKAVKWFTVQATEVGVGWERLREREGGGERVGEGGE